MFSRLTDFSYKRSSLQAVGFYITYLLAVMIAGAFAGIIGGLAAGEDADTFSNGVRLGTLVAIIFSVGLSFLILKAKKLTNRFNLKLLAITAGILALLGGGLLGLIIPAVFTTKPQAKSTKK